MLRGTVLGASPELMPSAIEVRIFAREPGAAGKTVFFEVLSADGGRAIRDGFVVLRG